jgi:hypothetical protein
MQLLYHVAIEDESYDPATGEQKKPGTAWVGYYTDVISHNLMAGIHGGVVGRPSPANQTITSEAVALHEFHVIKAVKHFRTLIDGEDIDTHSLHYLLGAAQQGDKLKMTIELRRMPDKGYPTTIVALTFVARITFYLVVMGDHYQFNFQIISGTEQTEF